MGYCFLYKRFGGSVGGSGHSGMVKTVLGKILSLSDSANDSLKGMRIFGKTTQNGTPTPDVPVPLESVGDGGSVGVTVCGKNLFAEGVVYLAGLEASKGRINTAYPSTSPTNRGAWGGVGIRVAVKPNTTYTAFSDVTPCKYFTITFYKSMDDVGTPANAISFIENATTTKTFTTPIDCYCVVITAVNNVESDFTWSKWQLELGPIATAYEPYKEAQTLTLSTPNGLPGIPVESGGNYTDENGQQWICDYVDFARGKYVQRVGKEVFDGSSDESWIVNGTNTSGKYRYATSKIKGLIALPLTNNQKVNAKTSAFITATAATGGTYSCIQGFSTDINGNVQCYSDVYNTNSVSVWNNYLSANPLTVLYELATPIETALTAEELAAYAALHTNYPNTTIYNDAGAGMEVKYTSIGG
jgi:hypothetical protein